jgi:hypothetical protein
MVTNSCAQIQSKRLLNGGGSWVVFGPQQDHHDVAGYPEIESQSKD